MKKFLQDFKSFALKGNVIDLAVGVIIGAAFQGIVNSLVNDLISPLLGLLFKVDFSDLQFTIRSVPILYGSFLTAVINFILMAFVIFLFVRMIGKIERIGKKPAPPVTPTTKKCPYCQSEISIKATRCPYCTSQIEEIEESN